jgi:cytochrome b561
MTEHARPAPPAGPTAPSAPTEPAPHGRYGAVAVALHWLFAALVLLMVGMGWYMVEIPRGTPERGFWFNLHKSFGVLAAMLVALRLVWRLRHRPPPWPTHMPQWQRAVVGTSHALLYAVLVMMPLSGFIASNFNRFGVKFFGLPLPRLAGESPALHAVFNTIHVYTSYLLVALVALHLIAALKHLLYDRDEVFWRMWPARRTAAWSAHANGLAAQADRPGR